MTGEKESGAGCCCSTNSKKTVPSEAAGCCNVPGKAAVETVDSGCCGTKAAALNDVMSEKRQLNIEFMYLDLSVCVPCQGTENSLEEAISEVSQVLKATGVEVVVHKINIQSEEQARMLGFVSSPTIRINGRDIQLEVKESLCQSCGDLCGDDVDCRVWVYQGKEYTIPPKAMIIEAILREVYGGEKEASKTSVQAGDVPDNLKRFFAAKRKKDALTDLKEVPASGTGSTCCGSSSSSGKCCG